MKKTHIITIQQVKDDLACFYADKLQQDRELLKNMLMSGQSEVPPISFLSETQLIDLFIKLDLGKRYSFEIDIVAVDTNDTWLKIVWKNNA